MTPLPRDQLRLRRDPPGLNVVRPRAARCGRYTSTLLVRVLPWGTLRALVLRGLNGDGVPGGWPWRPDAQEVAVP